MLLPHTPVTSSLPGPSKTENKISLAKAPNQLPVTTKSKWSVIFFNLGLLLILGFCGIVGISGKNSKEQDRAVLLELFFCCVFKRKSEIWGFLGAYGIH